MSPRHGGPVTAADMALARSLLPFLRAGRHGLDRSPWRPGQPPEDLVAPIVLAVLVEASRQLRLDLLLSLLAARAGPALAAWDAAADGGSADAEHEAGLELAGIVRELLGP